MLPGTSGGTPVAIQGVRFALQLIQLRAGPIFYSSLCGRKIQGMSTMSGRRFLRLRQGLFYERTFYVHLEMGLALLR